MKQRNLKQRNLKQRNLLQKIARQTLLGAAGFACSRIGVMGYYPMIPAFFTANYRLGDGGIGLYVGLLAGMGYCLTLLAMVKYTAALVAIAVGLRFYLWANRACSSWMGGLIAGLILVVMNLTGSMASLGSARELVLGISEGLMVMGLSVAIYDVRTLLPQFVHQIVRAVPADPPVKEVAAGRHEEQAAAFAAAVDGLSAAFSTMKRTKENSDREDVGALEQEITGRLCMACDGCAVCWEERHMDLSGRIRRMLQAVVAHHPREDIVQSGYVSSCPHYSSMVEEAIAAFERMELNQAWYRRLLENRMAIAGQLDAIAELMSAWSRADRNTDAKNRLLLTKIAFEVKERGLVAEQLHIYEDAAGRMYIQADVSSRWGGGIPGRKYVQALEKAVGQPLRPGQGTKSLLTKDPVRVTVYEDTAFYTMTGVSAKTKNGSAVSGDNYNVFTMENGHHFACLSDGMGTGARASQESGLVVDLLQKFLEAGFMEDMAIRMMNSAMVLQGEDHAYSTLDFADINLYDGTLTLYKIGAAASFLRRGGRTEYIASASLPAGAQLDLKPEVAQRTLEDGDFLVMVSDGVLEYLHVKKPEEKFAEIISDIPTDNANTLAQKAMERVMLFTGGYAMDDMSILVTGIWGK